MRGLSVLAKVLAQGGTIYLLAHSSFGVDSSTGTLHGVLSKHEPKPEALLTAYLSSCFLHQSLHAATLCQAFSCYLVAVTARQDIGRSILAIDFNTGKMSLAPATAYYLLLGITGKGRN